MSITTDDIFKLSDIYFYKKNILFSHLHDSYNKFIEYDIKNFLENNEHCFNQKITSNKVYKRGFKFSNIRIESPKDNNRNIIFPIDCIKNNLTYEISLIADVEQYQEVIDIETDEKIVLTTGNIEYDILISKIPLMVNSKFCSINKYKNRIKNECKYDPGGYFIINGNEKVIISQERMVDNKPLIFLKKESGNLIYTLQLNSKYHKDNVVRIINIILKKNKIIFIRLPIFLTEINVGIIFKAIDIESDKEIFDTILCNSKIDNNILIEFLDNTIQECIDNNGKKIKIKEQALDYLVSKLRKPQKNQLTIEHPPELHIYQKQKYLKKLLETNFLPHITGGFKEKGLYLGYIIYKLLLVYIGKKDPDNRDSYINKRIDLPGDILFDIFKQGYKKVLSECESNFKNTNNNDNTPRNIAQKIQNPIIEQSLKTTLSNGVWGNKNGVVQVLRRFSQLQYQSSLRRVDSSVTTTSTISKLTSIRNLHPSSVGFLCVTGDTLINLYSGIKKKMSDIVDGDEIVTINLDDFSKKIGYVKNKFLMIVKMTYNIHFSNSNIECTRFHKLYIFKDDKYQMEYAYLLKKDDKLVMYVNDEIYLENITKISIINKEKYVYDFETNENHNYIANNIISHNCTISTPEHSKIGLVKHLSLISFITTFSINQYELMKDYLEKKIKLLINISFDDIKKHFKVFLNGDWMGVTDKPYELDRDLFDKKNNNFFDQKNVSIVTSYFDKKIEIYCDSGRLCRPVFKVNDNKINLKKEYINQLSLDKNDKTKISNWDEFLIKYPDVIEYIDTEYQPFILISPDLDVLHNMYEKKYTKINIDKKIKENKYDDGFFLNYSHCEIHPSLLLGQLPANIPFANRNQGPRNIFQYSQGKQAMGIYTTNYRDRTDISYILHNTQKPLVSTRTSKYTGSENLPSGENVIVAIMCYTGYNQEDSIILNKTSVERGMFHSMSLKKYVSMILKNKISAYDDIFMKPDPSIVVGSNPDAYNKLGNDGIIEEETIVNDDDIIIGKVTPLQDNLEKFKDNSEKYKSASPGVVDRVYKNIKNNEGCETKKILIRSNKFPKIGDKFCSRHGQKGVCGILLDKVDMPFNNYISPDLIINPNAIPSRMTLGQIIECLVGKVGALNGKLMDGTSFENFDLSYIEKELERHGFEKDGTEELYCGITGLKIKSRIFIGPTYYQRLKHIVEDKIHARARGSSVQITRQPPEGRAKDGGFKLGEMERDAVISHGMSKFLNEKMLQNSDDYYINICNNCGDFVHRRRNENTEHKIYPSDKDTYICKFCNSYDYSRVRMPYVFKLLCQELSAINISTSLSTTSTSNY